MGVTERVVEFIDFKSITKYKFCKNLGFSNKFLDNSSNMGTDKACKILRYYPEIDATWLLTGDGNMLINENKKIEDLKTKKIVETEKKGIPLIPIEAMAGWGHGDVTVMNYDTNEYIVPEFDELNVDFMIRVKGSSMYPKYNSGDMVACKKIPLDTFFQWNKVYVLDTIQGAMIKRIKKSDLAESISCVSDNKSYDPFDLLLNEIYSLAIVVGVIRLE